MHENPAQKNGASETDLQSDDSHFSAILPANKEALPAAPPSRKSLSVLPVKDAAGPRQSCVSFAMPDLPTADEDCESQDDLGSEIESKLTHLIVTVISASGLRNVNPFGYGGGVDNG